ncbi:MULTISPECIES: sensor histidine kinase [Sporosarcina]|uniref:sensor histidine kinase n=1 Tax=Sporosarcina TaxID=1569 RepID=UPI00058CE2B7|nr:MULTISPECIES: sensor histidine kinase [Sporosarcina]WJY26650.1 sensor histidine kinase [Sporosarcina sp. 0.2-SM1T-5]
MSGFFWRAILLSFLFLAATAAGVYGLVEYAPVLEWQQLFEDELLEVPLGVWLAAVPIALGWSFSGWIYGIARNREKAVERSLGQLAEENPQPSTKGLSRKLKRSVDEISEVLDTQKRSLQRITDQRAEDQDKIIQERLIEERQRLARELHDSVSQQLFAASMLLSSLTEQPTADAARKPLLQVERMVQQAQLEMRALLLHLRPAVLNSKTLKEGLEELLVELQQKVTFTIRYRLEDVPLSKGAEDHLFRIAQETLSNTLRHAQATEVDVLFISRDELAIFRVQDNGVGFSEMPDRGGAYGLQNVKERAVEIGGVCKIVSVPSQGTIVEVKLPIRKGEDTHDPYTARG